MPSMFKSSPLSETVEISYPPPLSPRVERPKTERDARCLTATCPRRQPSQSRYLMGVTISTSSPLRDIFRSLQNARNTGHFRSMVNDAEIGLCSSHSLGPKGADFLPVTLFRNRQGSLWREICSLAGS
ncbi:hypothetical protein QR685DRAFT_227501 [Neurospora intermedia]|uniref:Uncharacterized protein n=1 Tax=Neurospora intermedia TaxID=5142 RepID=A0ABR3DJU4_NEUIN